MRAWHSDDLESIVCDFCGSNSVSREFIRADGMRVVECASCGLAFLNPRPRSDLIHLFYGEDYFTGASAERGEGGLRLTTDSQPKAGPKPRAMEIFSDHLGGPQRKDVLEVGCATGDLLLRFAAEGARVKGIELSDYAATLARKRGLDVTTGTIDDYANAHGDCADILIAFEVIEHVLSPKKFLQNAFKLIRPGGIMLLSTPNYACARRFGLEWLGFNTSFEHIYFFSPATLQKIAQSSGFLLRHMESSSFLGGPRPPAGFIRHQLERIKTIRYFVTETGIRSGIDAVLSRSKNCFRSGVGHTLIMAFEKPK